MAIYSFLVQVSFFSTGFIDFAYELPQHLKNDLGYYEISKYWDNLKTWWGHTLSPLLKFFVHFAKYFVHSYSLVYRVIHFKTYSVKVALYGKGMQIFQKSYFMKAS